MPVQLFPDPLADVVAGLRHRQQIALQVHQAAQEDQRARMLIEDRRRQEEDHKRRRQMEDIQAMQQMESTARPVQGGMVSQEQPIQRTMLDMGGVVPGSGEVPATPRNLQPANMPVQFQAPGVQRPADASRTMEWTTAAGNPLQFERMKRAELQARAIEELRAKAGMEAYGAGQRKAAEMAATYPFEVDKENRGEALAVANDTRDHTATKQLAEFNQGETTKRDTLNRAEQKRHNEQVEAAARATAAAAHLRAQAAGAAAGADINVKAANIEKSYRDDFARDTKPFREVALGWGRVQASNALKDPTGTNDIALLYGYMKMLDPGSVVREGEFATAAAAGGPAAKYANLYDWVVKGNKLTPEVRRQMVQQAKGLYDSAKVGYDATTRQFKDMAVRSRVDPRNVLIDYTDQTPQTGAPSPASRYAVGQTVKLKDGSAAIIDKINADGTFQYH